MARVGERNHARGEGEPELEGLRVSGSVRRVVVEEHDRLGDGHGSGRPGDHRQVARTRADVDPVKVGLWGISEGGWVVPAAGRRWGWEPVPATCTTPPPAPTK